MTEWYEHWFGEAYLDLYPHRDDRDAERAVSLLAARGAVGAATRVLDLACGAGRHAGALARLGATVIGFDLSLAMLRAAQRRTTAVLVRGDMRVLPFTDTAFDTVVNLFTSFGYFDRDDHHATVVAEVARVLRPGGIFALDYLNAAAVRSHLVPHDRSEAGGRTVVQRRRITGHGRFVVKTITVEGEGREFMERVRLFEREDLEALMAAAGLTVTAVFGDYDGSSQGPQSPRCLLLARRA